jgi:hypothetical protein
MRRSILSGREAAVTLAARASDSASPGTARFIFP